MRRQRRGCVVVRRRRPRGTGAAPRPHRRWRAHGDPLVACPCPQQVSRRAASSSKCRDSSRTPCPPRSQGRHRMDNIGGKSTVMPRMPECRNAECRALGAGLSQPDVSDRDARSMPGSRHPARLPTRPSYLTTMRARMLALSGSSWSWTPQVRTMFRLPVSRRVPGARKPTWLISGQSVWSGCGSELTCRAREL